MYIYIYIFVFQEPEWRMMCSRSTGRTWWWNTRTGDTCMDWAWRVFVLKAHIFSDHSSSFIVRYGVFLSSDLCSLYIYIYICLYIYSLYIYIYAFSWRNASVMGGVHCCEVATLPGLHYIITIINIIIIIILVMYIYIYRVRHTHTLSC